MDVIATFLKCEALLEGHFILSSGLHSNRYLQCAKILHHPKIADTKIMIRNEQPPNLL